MESSFYLGPVAVRFSRRPAQATTVKDTWLPPGAWVDLDDRTVYEGGKRVSIPAPLAEASAAR